MAFKLNIPVPVIKTTPSPTPTQISSQKNGPTNLQTSLIASAPTTRMKLSELTPADYNPRQISDYAKKGLTESINTFGLVQPIIYNKRTKNVVGGHQRLQVLLDQGFTETDVIVVDIPAIKEKALNITLNNKAIEGEFIQDQLDTIMNELKDIGSLEGINLDKLQMVHLLPMDFTPFEEPKGDIGNPNSITFIRIAINSEDQTVVSEIRDTITEYISTAFDKSIVEIKK